MGQLALLATPDEIGVDDERDRELFDWAGQGDEAALRTLAAFMDEKRPDLWRTFGDIAEIGQRSLIEQTAGKDHLARLAMERNLERLRADLAQPGDGALEQLLIERVLTCWLQVGYADLAGALDGRDTAEWAEYYQRRIDQAHRRLLSATRTLATVRKLARPSVQVNLAQQQINLAS